MAKNGFKMVEIFLGASHMINDYIFNIFCFSTFSFGYFTNPVFWPNLEKIALKTRSRKYPKEKVEKQKMLKMLLFIICEAPQKISTIFKPFLAIFTLFHLKNWPYLQKPEFGNLAKTRFWFLLVNNSLCSIPLSWARSYIKETPGDRCVTPTTAVQYSVYIYIYIQTWPALTNIRLYYLMERFKNGRI